MSQLWDVIDLNFEQSDWQADAAANGLPEEPALEIALPQVFEQPRLYTLQRGRLKGLNELISRISRRHLQEPGAALGEDYQNIVNEFQPLFLWATTCWDFLLSTEGCRFVPRLGEQRYGIRGDYRVVTDKDYSRIVHRLFRQLLLDYALAANGQSFSNWLRERFWPAVLDAYRGMDRPLDPSQRRLTAYSYLRCVPYAFLNPFHQTLVYNAVEELPHRQRLAVTAYFLQFCTEDATAGRVAAPVAETLELLRQGLVTLLIHNRLAYCLLRQIERY